MEGKYLRTNPLPNVYDNPKQQLAPTVAHFTNKKRFKSPIHHSTLMIFDYFCGFLNNYKANQ
jgi:hypothetical protein